MTQTTRIPSRVSGKMKVRIVALLSAQITGALTLITLTDPSALLLALLVVDIGLSTSALFSITPASAWRWLRNSLVMSVATIAAGIVVWLLQA